MNVLARWTAMIALAGLVAGCSNPNAGVIEAEVGDALPLPAEAADPAVAAVAADAEDPAEADAATEPSGTADEAGPVVAFDGSNSKIDFVGSKLVGSSHDGGFKAFTGKFALAPGGDGVSSVETTIDMESTWTDNDKLTGHLKNGDFFEVETYPEAEFVSTSITPVSTPTEGATHEVTGNLTLHGTTKSITFPATVALTDEAVSLDSEFKIDRTIWGIVYGAEADVRDNIISKDVVIRLDIDAPRDAAG